MVKTHIVATEAVQMLSPVGRKIGDDLRCYCVALINQLLENSRHRHHVVKDHQVGYQMIVPDDLALLFPVVVTDHTLTAKSGPLHKLVPVFRNIRRGIDGPPKLRIANEIE